MQNLTQELRYAVRQLSKSPAFAITAVLTLALGIGANTAIFTVVQSLLLKPLEYPEADRIVALNTRWEHKAHIIPRMTGPDLVDIRDQAKSIQAIGYLGGRRAWRGVARSRRLCWGERRSTRALRRSFRFSRSSAVGLRTPSRNMRRWSTLHLPETTLAVLRPLLARSSRSRASRSRCRSGSGQLRIPEPHPGMDGLSGTAGVDFADRIQLSRRSAAAAWGSARNGAGGACRNRRALASDLSQRQRGQELQVRASAGAACRRSAADAAAVDVLGRAGAVDCLRQRNATFIWRGPWSVSASWRCGRR